MQEFSSHAETALRRNRSLSSHAFLVFRDHVKRVQPGAKALRGLCVHQGFLAMISMHEAHKQQDYSPSPANFHTIFLTL
jgi:hypothetical protein